MNENLQNWLRRKAGDILEVSKEISRSAKKLCETAYQTVSELEKTEKTELPYRKRSAPVKPKPSDPRAAQQKLTEQMDREIHRAYYKDGGFRFFGCSLRQYAAVAMEQETELQLVWAGAYNTNIRPMLRQMTKLEQTLKQLRSQFACEPLPLQNAQLLELMRAFSRKVQTDRLDQDTDWQIEDYRQAVRSYVSELSGQLLDKYQLPTEEQE